MIRSVLRYCVLVGAGALLAGVLLVPLAYPQVHPITDHAMTQDQFLPYTRGCVKSHFPY